MHYISELSSLKFKNTKKKKFSRITSSPCHDRLAMVEKQVHTSAYPSVPKSMCFQIKIRPVLHLQRLFKFK